MDNFTQSVLLLVMAIFAYKTAIHQLLWNTKHSVSENIVDLKDKEVFQLATINVTRAEESEEGFFEVSKELIQAFEGVGFAYVTDLKGFDPDQLLYWTKWFFNLPIDVKKKITKKAFNPDSANVYRGLYLTVPGGHSFKEAFEQGVFERDTISRQYPTAAELTNQSKINGQLYMRNVLEEKNIWPITDNQIEDEQFRNVMTKQYHLYLRTCVLIMRMLASGLGFEKNKFDHLFLERTLSTNRLIHYPTRLHAPETIPAEAWDGDKAIVTGEHFDSGILTILATFDNAGLQIKPHGFPRWIDVPATKNHLVINIGNLLADIVENRLVATNHRVLDIGVSRYSVPFFLEPNYDGDISKTIYGNEIKGLGEYKTYAKYMTNRTRMFAEYKTIDWGYAD